MATKPKGTRRGRPPLSPEKRKRNNVTLRLRDGLKKQLEEQAATMGRSLSEEIEFQLERTFLTDKARRDREDRAFGGAHTHALVRLFGDTIKDVETWTGGTWAEDQYTFDQVRLGINTFMDALRPTETDDDNPRPVDRMFDTESQAKLPPEMAAEMRGTRNRIGAIVALSHLEQLKITIRRGKPQEALVRGDGLQLAYDTAPIIAPLIGRKKD
ncbi:MAG: hypothetical protein O2967_22950 [Proteobacteria bacterium]|nr:hypothetical protein [Pseudomonadota bacterium]